MLALKQKFIIVDIRKRNTPLHGYTGTCMQQVVAIRVSNGAGLKQSSAGLELFWDPASCENNNKREATKKETGLREIDVSICYIFSRISHDLYALGNNIQLAPLIQ